MRRAKEIREEIFFTKQHEAACRVYPNADGIMSTASWPTFSPLSAQFRYGVSELLSQLDATCNSETDNEPWETASRCWRGVFFSGEEPLCNDLKLTNTISV